YQTSNSQRGYYVWNPQDEALIRPFFPISFSANRIGRPCVANFDADEDLEVAMGIEGPGSTATVRVFDNDWTQMWSIPTLDESGAIGCSAFDFNADGVYEILTRDQQQMRILEGPTGAVIAATPCTSGTIIEYPVIADINADGQSEVLCNCGGNAVDVDLASVRAWNSANIPWPPSRPVWNQTSYFITNVEDNLQIPIVQQNPHLVGDGLVLNQFLTQYSNPIFPLPDAQLTVLDIACQDQAIVITAEVCNIGDYRLGALTPFTIYDENPTSNGSATVLGTFTPFTEPLEVGECVTVSFSVPAGASGNYAVIANDDGGIPPIFDLATDFPSTNIYECDYENNIDQTDFQYLPPILDLGPDTSLCDFSVIVIDAGPGFESYTWQDGFTEQIYTAFEPGTYVVTTVDSCGGVQMDSLTINLEVPGGIDLGADTTICLGASLSFDLSGFDSYQWVPSTYLDCDTCATVVATPDSTITYIVQGTLEEQCIAVDTIQITVVPETIITDTLSLCEGDTILVFGDPISQAGTYEEVFSTLDGCDSTVIITVVPTDTTTIQTDTLMICQGETVDIFGEAIGDPGVYVQIDSSTSCLFIDSITLMVFDTITTLDSISICDNETVNIFGVQTNVPGTYSQVFQTSNGCDSIHYIELEVRETFLSEETIVICPGDSALIFGNYEFDAGVYNFSYQAVNFCDSSVTITLEVLPELDLAVTTTSSCFGENDGSAVLEITGGLPPYLINWSSPTQGEDLLPGTYSVSVTDDNGCSAIEVFTIEQSGVDALEYEVTDISCFGFSNGQLFILSDFEGLLFSFDGVIFTEQT
ncbi:MAG: SprB repeat-containing protein, partial [Bacteroidota bacterium]